MEVDHMALNYGHMEHYGIGSQPYCLADSNSNHVVPGQYYPENAPAWSTSSIHPFHENVNWASYGLPNPGAKCPPMSAHAYAIARRNERERNRVRHINSTFENLRKHLPSSGRKRKLSKVDTLKTAAKYIKHLQQILESTGEAVGKNSLKTKIIADNNNVLLADNIKKERCCSPTEDNSRLSLTDSDVCSRVTSPGSDYKQRDSVSPTELPDEPELMDDQFNRGSRNVSSVSKVKDFSSCRLSGKSHENLYTPCFLGGVNQEDVLSRTLYDNSGYLHHHHLEGEQKVPERMVSSQHNSNGVHGLPSAELSNTTHMRGGHLHQGIQETRPCVTQELFINTL